MDLTQVALFVLLFTAGAQTPLVALFALRRRRTLLIVLGPYALLVPLAIALGNAVDAPTRLGLLALAVAPAELAAPGIAAAIRARIDTTGAYLAGTVAVSFALTFAFIGASAPEALRPARDAAFAFLLGMSLGGALPTIRDRILAALRRLADLALVVLVAVAVSGAWPHLGGTAVALALLLLVAGAGAAVVAAGVGGGHQWSALAGAGSRDFAVAATVAAAAMPAAAVVPLVYGALLFLGAALLVLLRRQDAGRADREGAEPGRR